MEEAATSVKTGEEELAAPLIVDFPLRGEWRALNTPAHRVPSHGTDELGQRYAFDFVRMDAEGTRYSDVGLLRQVVSTVDARRFLSWEQPVSSAFAGRVCEAGDSWPDRMRVTWAWELLRSTFVPPTVHGHDFRPIFGNFVMIESDCGVALYAHLRIGSVRVRAGDRVEVGDPLGLVGNSGNSTMPHLHFHIMDGADPLAARGIPCAYRRYERFERGAWLPVENGVPGQLERIRAD